MRTTGKKGVGSAVKSMRVVLTVTIILVVFVMLYFHFSNVEPKEKDEEKVSNVVEQLLSKDLEANYPVTVREVVMHFTEIQQCYYNENVNEEQLEKLATRARMLFDDELLAANPYDEYYADLKEEINSYKSTKKTITRVIVDKSSEVDILTLPEDGSKVASIEVAYYCKEDGNTTRTLETYVLRKDANDRWKIYGWGVMEGKQD